MVLLPPFHGGEEKEEEEEEEEEGMGIDFMANVSLITRNVAEQQKVNAIKTLKGSSTFIRKALHNLTNSDFYFFIKQ